LKRNATHKYWKFNCEYGVEKNSLKKIIWKDIFFMPHFRMGQTNSSMELFQGTTYET
jgi:hypothetical protein